MLTREVVTIILNEKLACINQNGGAYEELLEANSRICHPLQECLLILYIKLHNGHWRRELVCHDALFDNGILCFVHYSAFQTTSAYAGVSNLR